jgi:hypothetical protein
MTIARAVAVLAASVVLVACGDDTGIFTAPAKTDAASPAIDAGTVPLTLDAGSGEVNPMAQVPYPAEDVGGRPRSAGQPGQTLPNLTLTGIRSVASLDASATVSMADYFDPQGARYDLLHVIGIFMWCSHCNNETNNLSRIADWQAQHRVAALQIAMQGYGGSAPTWTELQKWVSDHNLTVPVLLDPSGAQLGQSFKVNSVPVNIVVNPRTMEVLAVNIGEVGDLQSYEQGFLDRL